MQSIVKQVPNALTLGNLVCGLLVIVSSFDHQFEMIVYLAIGSLLFDFLDGTAARLLRVSSPMGKELDSMADVISFGAAPSFVLFNYWSSTCSESLLPYAAFLIAVFSAYRLAKFNISDQVADYFSGLPTPALGLACFALPMAAMQSDQLEVWLTNPIFIILFCTIGSLLLVSKVKLFSLKIGSSNKQLNTIRIALLLVCVVLIAWLHFFGAFLCLLIYLLFSLIFHKQIS